MWCDLVFAFGFCSSSGLQTDPSRGSDYVVVPRGLSREELQRYKEVLTGLIGRPNIKNCMQNAQVLKFAKLENEKTFDRYITMMMIIIR